MGILDGNFKMERIDEQANSPELFAVQETTKKQGVKTLLERIKKNPEVVEQLHIVLNVMEDDAKKGRTHRRNRRSAHTPVPLNEVRIDLHNFQNRRTPYSKSSVQGIMDSVLRGEYIKALMNPCILRKSPEGKDYILAGHSRYEAFCRLDKIYNDDMKNLAPDVLQEIKNRCNTNQYDIKTLPSLVQERCKSHDYYFSTLPSLYIQDMTFEDAKTVALMSNALASAETDVERANVYRFMKNSMKHSREIESFGKKCEKANRARIRSYSYLAANGLAMDTLDAFESGEDSNTIIKIIARWVGELRRKMPEISDTHENELFDRLLNKGIYGKNKQRGELLKMEDFIKTVKEHVQYLKIKGNFQYDGPLNIAKNKQLSYIMQYYSKSLEEFRTKKSVLLETFHKTRRQISKLKTNKDIPTEKKAFIEELSRKLGLSLDALNKMEDVHTATDLLFDEQEIYLSPGEDLERLEETQKTILEAIKKIEEDYYLFLQKKPSIEEKEKNILKLDFEPQT